MYSIQYAYRDPDHVFPLSSHVIGVRRAGSHVVLCLFFHINDIGI